MEENAEEIAENAGAVVESIITAPLAQAIENENHARELAEEIASAALETERGREISALRERIDECLLTVDQLPSLMADQVVLQMQSLGAELRAEMTTLVASLSAPVAAPVAVAPLEPLPNELTPPHSVEEVIPAELTPPPSEPAFVPPARKRNRFL